MSATVFGSGAATADAAGAGLLVAAGLSVPGAPASVHPTANNAVKATKPARLVNFFPLAAGPHPRRELTLMPRLGFTCPRLGMAAGASAWAPLPCKSSINIGVIW